MPSNVELKARLADLAAARTIAARLATAPPTTQQQRDTYFVVAQGRLKLREIDQQPAELIAYARPDQPGPKQSDYRRVLVAEPAELRQALADTCGIWLVVEKRREIYLHHNVRIHLDEVRDLGPFLEFEAVLGPNHSAAEGQRQVDELSAAFGLTAADCVAGSYSDLLAAQHDSAP